jgi:hypothetical protein
VTVGTYEALLASARALRPPANGERRNLHWCDRAHTLALCRDDLGRCEIFVVGPRLVPTIQAVRDSLEHNSWSRQQGEPIDASRLVLPASGPFDQVAAFLCTELLREGVAIDAVGAFRRCEPVIALVLAQLHLSDAATLGLCGELVVLEALVSEAPPEARNEVLQGWHGHRRSARDIQIRGVGVEVKTTTGATSKHHVQGVHQVEPRRSEDGGEHSLLLVSVGVGWSTEGDVTTLPELVARILGLVDSSEGLRSEVAQTFIDHVRDYGDEEAIGYDHDDPTVLASFDRAFRIGFVRTYDMADPAINVLRSVDLDTFDAVVPDSATFEIQLPLQVRGDANPVVGTYEGAAEVLRRASIL